MDVMAMRGKRRTCLRLQQMQVCAGLARERRKRGLVLWHGQHHCHLCVVQHILQLPARQ